MPPRHLEPVLQSLVRGGILRGVRGPRGGYEFAGDRQQVTANDILRAAQSVDEDERPHAGSELLHRIVLPAMAAAEQEFAVALSRITLDEMVRDALALLKRAASRT